MHMGKLLVSTVAWARNPQFAKRMKFVTFVVELSLVNRRELLRGSAFGGVAIVGLNT